MKTDLYVTQLIYNAITLAHFCHRSRVGRGPEGMGSGHTIVRAERPADEDRERRRNRSPDMGGAI